MKLSSSAFDNNSTIPSRFGYKHGNISPPLKIENIPESTKSLVLIMDDPDAMGAVGKVWTHWVLWNIPPETKQIFENSIPEKSIQGINDFEEIGYGGPAPPDKEHTYILRLFAINKILDNPIGSTKLEIKNSITSFIIETAKLEGKFSPQ